MLWAGVIGMMPMRAADGNAQTANKEAGIWDF